MLCEVKLPRGYNLESKTLSMDGRIVGNIVRLVDKNEPEYLSAEVEITDPTIMGGIATGKISFQVNHATTTPLNTDIYRQINLCNTIPELRPGPGHIIVGSTDPIITEYPKSHTYLNIYELVVCDLAR